MKKIAELEAKLKDIDKLKREVERLDKVKAEKSDVQSEFGVVIRNHDELKQIVDRMIKDLEGLQYQIDNIPKGGSGGSSDGVPMSIFNQLVKRVEKNEHGLSDLMKIIEDLKKMITSLKN